MNRWLAGHILLLRLPVTIALSADTSSGTLAPVKLCDTALRLNTRRFGVYLTIHLYRSG